MRKVVGVLGLDQLDGYIYHMVHFDNLRNIFQRRALLSKEGVMQEAIEYQSIAYENVQNLTRLYPIEVEKCRLQAWQGIIVQEFFPYRAQKATYKKW